MEITAFDRVSAQPLHQPGRSKAEHSKVPVTMRVDADVLDAIKASGSGWQTCVNDVLRDAELGSS